MKSVVDVARGRSSNFVTAKGEQKHRAFQDAVHRYLPQILRAARASGLNTQHAEDVAQDTFVTFIESAHRFEGRSHVRTWLFGILYKKIAAARRGLQHDQSLRDIDEIFEQRFDITGSWMSPPRPSDSAVYDEEVRDGIEDCLDLVPEKQRMAFLLREVEGMKAIEISEVLAVTPGNLSVLLHRVRNRLRDCLVAKGIEPT